MCKKKIIVFCKLLHRNSVNILKTERIYQKISKIDMLIANKYILFRFFLIIFVLVISLLNLQLIPRSISADTVMSFVPKLTFLDYLDNYKNILNFNYVEKDKNISFLYLFSNQSDFCFYRWRDLDFSIFDCKKREIGSFFILTGTIDTSTASQNNGQKRLLIQSIKPIATFADSDISSIKGLIALIGLLVHGLSNYRIFLRTGMEDSFSPQTYSFLTAMILGDKSLLEDSTRHIFKITGSLHVLAVSGMHLSLLFDMLQRVSSRFQRIVRFFSQVVLIILYSIMVGGSASVVRALGMVLFRIMGSVILYRQINSAHSLVVVTMVMLILNSWYLTQVGFQLSVCATGIIIGYLQYKKWILSLRTIGPIRSGISPSIKRVDDSSRWAMVIGSIPSAQSTSIDISHESIKDSILFSVKNYLKETASVGLVVQVFLAPLLWWHFGEVSWVGVLAGPASLWLVPPLFISTFLFIFIYTCLGLISKFELFFQSFFVLKPFALICTLLLFSLRLVLYLINFVIEFLSRSFLFILSLLTDLTQDWALLAWPEFSLTETLIWYFVVGCILCLYTSYLVKKHKKSEKTWYA